MTRDRGWPIADYGKIRQFPSSGIFHSRPSLPYLGVRIANARDQTSNRYDLEKNGNTEISLQLQIEIKPLSK